MVVTCSKCQNVITCASSRVNYPDSSWPPHSLQFQVKLIQVLFTHDDWYHANVTWGLILCTMNNFSQVFKGQQVCSKTFLRVSSLSTAVFYSFLTCLPHIWMSNAYSRETRLTQKMRSIFILPSSFPLDLVMVIYSNSPCFWICR